MTIYLRNKRGETIADIEIWNKVENGKTFCEISSSINIDLYSELLLGVKEEDRRELIRDFEDTSRLREWLWESYKVNNPNCDATEVKNFLKDKILNVADEWGLKYVED